MERAIKKRCSEKYGLSHIEKCIINTSGIKFDEQDLQGIFLITSDEQMGITECSTQKRNIPRQRPIGWESIMDKYGIESVILVSNLNMVQMLLGVVEGFYQERNTSFQPYRN